MEKALIGSGVFLGTTTLLVLLILLTRPLTFEKRFKLRTPRIAWCDPDTSPDKIRRLLLRSDVVILCPSKWRRRLVYRALDLLTSNRSAAVGVWVDMSRTGLRTDFLLIRKCALSTRFVDKLVSYSDYWKIVCFPGLWKRVEKNMPVTPLRVFAGPLVSVFSDEFLDPVVDVFQLKQWTRMTRAKPLIVQTWVNYSTNVEYLKECQDRIISLNPDYEYAMFSDYDMIRFVGAHYGPVYVNVLEQILPGAYRSDFFRLLFLHEFGGVYSDISLLFSIGFDRLKDIAGTDLILVIDNQNGDLCLFNAFMVAPPRHPVVRECIDLIVGHVLKKVTPQSLVLSPDPCLHLTGPCALGQAFLTIYGGDHIIESETGYMPHCMLLRHYHSGRYIATIDERLVIARTRHHLGSQVTEQMHRELMSPHYSAYCHRERIWLLDENADLLS